MSLLKYSGLNISVTKAADKPTQRSSKPIPPPVPHLPPPLVSVTPVTAPPMINNNTGVQSEPTKEYESAHDQLLTPEEPLTPRSHPPAPALPAPAPPAPAPPALASPASVAASPARRRAVEINDLDFDSYSSEYTISDAGSEFLPSDDASTPSSDLPSDAPSDAPMSPDNDASFALFGQTSARVPATPNGRAAGAVIAGSPLPTSDRLFTAPMVPADYAALDGPAWRAPRDGQRAKLSDLERVWFDMKKRRPCTLLAVENGYRVSFFGADSAAMSSVLAMQCSPPYENKQFYTGSFPVNNLDKHAARLAGNGFEVGLVKQVQAAIERKMASQSGNLERRITEVVTRAVMGDVGTLTLAVAETPTGLAYAYMDWGIGQARSATIDFAPAALVSVISQLTSELGPAEIILAGAKHALRGTDLTALPATVARPTAGRDLVAAIKLVAPAVQVLTVQSDGPMPTLGGTEEAQPGEVDQFVGPGPAQQLLARYAASIGRLKALFMASGRGPTVDAGVRRVCFLSAGATASLHVFGGQDTLMGVLGQHTRTPAGKRLLGRWLAAPLAVASDIRARLDAVERAQSPGDWVLAVKNSIGVIGDLERSAGKVCQHVATERQIEQMVKGVNRMVSAMKISVDNINDQVDTACDYWTNLRNRVAQSYLVIHELINAYQPREEMPFAQLEPERFSDLPHYAVYTDALADLARALADAAAARAQEAAALQEVRELVDDPNIEFIQVMNERGLVELTRVTIKRLGAPVSEWPDIRPTTKVARLRSPATQSALDAQDLAAAHTTRARAAAALAYQGLFQGVRAEALVALGAAAAEVDAICGLADAAVQNHYVKPQIVDDDVSHFSVRQLRHPVCERLGPYVPCQHAEITSGTCIGLSGPAASGKSTFSRAMALSALMAQAGSFVAADSLILAPFSDILVRTGARDELFSGLSTFAVECTEAAEICNRADRRSLVVLDEFGRGTSARDGAALAASVLTFIVQAGAAVVFASHYEEVIRNAAAKQLLRPMYFRFDVNRDGSLHNHYEMTDGYGPSHGLPAAAAAGVGVDTVRMAFDILQNNLLQTIAASDDIDSLQSSAHAVVDVAILATA